MMQMRVMRSGVMAAALAYAGAAGAQEATTSISDTGDELIIEVGPVDLPMPMAMEGHDDHAGIYPPIGEVTVPRDVKLYGFDYEVVDAEGNLLPSAVVHHFNVIDPDHRELFLPISRRILAAGSETGGQSMPWFLFGLPMAEGQRLVVSAMLHNPTGAAHEDVSLRIRLAYVKGGRPWPLFSVYPYQLDVAFPAGDKSFDLPPGESSRSYEASPAVAGRLMVMGAHLHELATRIAFEDLTEGETIWEGFPVEEGGELAGVTIGRLYWRLGVKIVPDHTYRVTVYYDNPNADTLSSGGMGVVAGVFMPSDEWPEADKGDPLYALDRSHYMREVRGTYDVIAVGGGKVGAMGDMGEMGEMKHDDAAGTADHQHNNR